MKNKISLCFILLAMSSLLGGMLFGLIGAIQFIFPDFLRALPFFKVRPLHVSLVVAWIFLSAIGGIYYYLPKFKSIEWKWKNAQIIHFIMFVVTGSCILACYFAGKFGGREYWEFPPWLAIPIIVSWIVFGLNYFQSVFSEKGKWPVYFWMWATGIFFFFFTFVEAYLWLIPYFRENIVRDMTVQWKAYGALTGSWNMLVYGTAIFVMERVSGDKKPPLSKLSFALYFLGLFNLMFGWAHHIYTLPVMPWVRYFAYGVSMTEWIILAKIIHDWRKSLSAAKKNLSFLPYKFLFSADVWVFLNLIVALLISIPAVNLFTHGTHVTVAHAMGSTIGINTMILLASCSFIVGDASGKTFKESRIFLLGFWLTQGSLLIFWLSLIGAGIQKGILITVNHISFSAAMNSISPWLKVFTFSGIGLLCGMLITVIPMIATLQGIVFKRKMATLPELSQLRIIKTETLKKTA